MGFGFEIRKDDDKEASPIVKKLEEKQKFSQDFTQTKYKENPYYLNPYYQPITPIGYRRKT